MKNAIKKIAHSGLKRHKFSLCTWHRENWRGKKKTWYTGKTVTTVLLQNKEKPPPDVGSVPLAKVPGQGGNAQVNRCALLALCRGFWYIQATHTHTCRGVWVLALVHWPGAGLYPPAPQSLLSPAAVPVGSNPSAFSVSLIPFPNHFYNSPSPWNLPSLSFFFPPNPFYHSNH